MTTNPDPPALAEPNRWPARVVALDGDAVRVRVHLTLPGGAAMAALVGRASAEALGLAPGVGVIACCPAQAVVLARGRVPPGATSAGAALPGCVATLRPTPVRVDVALRLDGGALLHTVLTPAAVRSLGLAPGTAATALINPQQVLLLASLPPVPAPASPPASPPATPAATPRPPA